MPPVALYFSTLFLGKEGSPFLRIRNEMSRRCFNSKRPKELCLGLQVKTFYGYFCLRMQPIILPVVSRHHSRKKTSVLAGNLQTNWSEVTKKTQTKYVRFVDGSFTFYRW